MIVRMWHGRVPTEKAEAYRAFLIERAIPDYQSVEGNLSVKILQRREDDATHFMNLHSAYLIMHARNKQR